MARERGLQVLLRIEDHDAQRSQTEYERAILEDLEWLGFVPDLPLTRQSDRHAHYAHAAANLEARGLLYGCRCTRQELQSEWYPGRCRERGIGLDPDVGWRLRLEAGDEHFDDLLLGPQCQRPAEQCGDVLIRDRLGNWTYQFVASVDDFLQDVALVVRGRDLLGSTGRQIRIARLIGRPAPARFAHHSLVMKSPTQKLSKSDGDTGVRDLRAAGWSPEAIIALARASCALAPGRG